MRGEDQATNCHCADKIALPNTHTYTHTLSLPPTHLSAPLISLLPSRSVSRLTSNLFCTLTRCFFFFFFSPLAHHFYFHVSPHMYQQHLFPLPHLSFFLLLPPLTHKFYIHVIDSFHYLVILERRRCLKVFNILSTSTLS